MLRPWAGRRSPGLGLHHGLRTLRRRGHPGRLRGHAAAAGGLVVRNGQGPLFCADAVADPLTGLTAAGACLEALESGGRWLLDVSMAAVSAELAGPTLPAPEGLVVQPPRARPVEASAPGFGADTVQVLAELGIES